MEFTSYHAGSDGLAASEFLGDTSNVMTVELSDEERERKRQACACFRTQAQTLKYFPIAIERFRPAPDYDFTQPPHEGRLFYENYDWGMTSGSFCELASRGDPGAQVVNLTILSVAYPLAPVGADAVGGAEQVLAQVERAAVEAGHRSVVIASKDHR